LFSLTLPPFAGARSAVGNGGGSPSRGSRRPRGRVAGPPLTCLDPFREGSNEGVPISRRVVPHDRRHRGGERCHRPGAALRTEPGALRQRSGTFGTASTEPAAALSARSGSRKVFSIAFVALHQRLSQGPHCISALLSCPLPRPSGQRRRLLLHSDRRKVPPAFTEGEQKRSEERERVPKRVRGRSRGVLRCSVRTP
jgi:hypothetical protein